MKKNMLNLLSEILAVFVILGLIILIVWVETNPHKISKDFCEDLGYKKVTDEKVEGFTVIGVECDKEYIFNVCEKKRCIEKDKWGICSYEYYLEIQNSTNKCN